MNRAIVALAFVLSAGIGFSRAEERNKSFDSLVDASGIKAADGTAVILRRRPVECRPETSETLKTRGEVVKARPVTRKESITSNSPIGRNLYRKMQEADYYVRQGCSGGNCNILWQQELSSFNSFHYAYTASVPVSYSADKVLGDMAYRLAKGICNEPTSTGTGSAIQLLYKLANAENLAMADLKELQEAAGRSGDDVEFCEAYYRY